MSNCISNYISTCISNCRSNICPTAYPIAYPIAYPTAYPTAYPIFVQLHIQLHIRAPPTSFQHMAHALSHHSPWPQSSPLPPSFAFVSSKNGKTLSASVFVAGIRLSSRTAGTPTLCSYPPGNRYSPPITSCHMLGVVPGAPNTGLTAPLISSAPWTTTATSSTNTLSATPTPSESASDGRATTERIVVDCPCLTDRGTGNSGSVCTTAVLLTLTLASFRYCGGVEAVRGCGGGMKFEKARPVIWNGCTDLMVRKRLILVVSETWFMTWRSVLKRDSEMSWPATAMTNCACSCEAVGLPRGVRFATAKAGAFFDARREAIGLYDSAVPLAFS